MSDNTFDTNNLLNQNNNEDIYNYLVENLDGTNAKIERLDNGGIWVTNWNAEGSGNNQLYIPPNINSNNVSMVSYLPGDGGFGSCGDP